MYNLKQQIHILLERHLEKKAIKQQAALIYKKIVQLARKEMLFSPPFHLKDDVNGRFESLALHLFLFYEWLRGLEAQTPLARPLADAIANIVTRDIEDNLRELGAGDMKIGKKVKVMTLRLYGRLDAYWGVFHAPEKYMQEGHSQLDLQLSCLKHNIYMDDDNEQASMALIGYITQSRQALAGISIAKLLSDEFDFSHKNDLSP